MIKGIELFSKELYQEARQTLARVEMRNLQAQFVSTDSNRLDESSLQKKGWEAKGYALVFFPKKKKKKKNSRGHSLQDTAFSTFQSYWLPKSACLKPTITYPSLLREKQHILQQKLLLIAWQALGDCFVICIANGANRLTIPTF